MAMLHDTTAALVLLEDVTNAQFRLEWVFKDRTDEYWVDPLSSSRSSYTLTNTVMNLKSEHFFFKSSKVCDSELRVHPLCHFLPFHLLHFVDKARTEASK